MKSLTKDSQFLFEEKENLPDAENRNKAAMQMTGVGIFLVVADSDERE